MAFLLQIETLWTKANRGSCPAVATDKCHSKDGLNIIITIGTWSNQVLNETNGELLLGDGGTVGRMDPDRG